jgi:hypothetical protein
MQTGFCRNGALLATLAALCLSAVLALPVLAEPVEIEGENDLDVGQTLLVGLVEQDGRPVVSWTRVVSGRTSARPVETGRFKGAVVELTTDSGRILAGRPVTFSRVMTVPMARPGSDDPPAPARIRMDNPRTVVAIPFNERAAFLQIRRPGETGATSRIALGTPFAMKTAPKADGSGRLTPLERPAPRSGSSPRAYAGPRINVLFMPSGLGPGQGAKFEAAAWNFITALAGMEPFSNFPDALNFWT